MPTWSQERTQRRAIGIPISTVLALVALLAAIAAAELGWRVEPSHRGAPLPVPHSLAGPIGQLRSIPVTAIDDPRSGAIAAGVVFGRTEHVAAEDEQAFLASGLWHLLT
ncbi:MAG: hypothetical protein JWM86_583 [Thermoleophilia bacterium]|nr:hypothetical protein [Thermoleophilia bacterium]